MPEWRHRALLIFLGGSLASLIISGCDTGGDKRGSDGNGEATGSEESPSARILPEPLAQGSTRLSSASDLAAEGEGPVAPPKKREKPRPFPFLGALEDDSLRRGAGAAGFEMELQVSWPEAKKSLRIKEEDTTLWPTMRVQLLRETADQMARLRVVLESTTFPLPVRSELRARADRLGYLVLWPDSRSYRVVPKGALHSIFSDRRVDRTPFVEPEVRSMTTGTRLGKPTQVLTLKTPLGETHLEFVEVKELTYAAPLLCALLLELVRIEGNESLCGPSLLPVHLDVTWQGGGTFTVTTLSWGAVADMGVDGFRAPPDLPIFKRGELPPFEPFFLSLEDRLAHLPVSLRREAPLPVPNSPAGDPSIQIGAPELVPKPGPPRNEVIVTNTQGRALVVLMNRVPFLWLGPGESVPLYSSGAEMRLSARTFLGDLVLPEQLVAPPGTVRLGAPLAPTTAAGTAPSP